MKIKPSHLRRSIILAMAGLLTAPVITQTAVAEPTLSDKPIRLVVGATAGGAGDRIARIIGKQMEKSLNTQVIVENRDGAGGNIGASYVAKAAPDGHTLLLASTSHGINPSLFTNMPFDPVKDFTPISMVTGARGLLVVNPATDIRSVEDLLSHAKENPGKLNFAVGGVGSSLHMATEQFKIVTGADITSVPYKGTAPAVTEVVGGHLEAMFGPVADLLPHIQSERLRLIAVTAPQRMKEFPDVPTVSETVPGFESRAWWGVLGPAGMPRDLVDKLNVAVNQAIESDEAQEFFTANSLEASGSTPEAWGEFIGSEVDRWKGVVKTAGIPKFQ